MKLHVLNSDPYFIESNRIIQKRFVIPEMHRNIHWYSRKHF